jgi:outer membrane protein, heavy metal efflux system
VPSSLRRAVVAAALILLSLPQLAAAEPEALRLSLEETLRRAEVGLAMRLAGAEISRAAGARLGALPLVPANPFLSFDIGPRWVEGTTQTSFAARIEQPLDLFGQRGRRLAAADQAVALTQAQRLAVRAAVRAEVRMIYVGVLASQRRETVVLQRLETMKKTLVAARERVRVGAASEVETQLAELEQGRAELALVRARRETAELLAELRELLDLSPAQPLALSTELGLPPPRSETVEGLVQRARTRRADYLAYQQERKVAEAEIERWRRERFPAVGLAFSVQRDNPQDTWFGIGLTVAPPIVHRNQAAIAMASAARLRAETLVEVASRGIERTLRRTLESAASRRRELQLSEGALLRAAERARDLVMAGWRAGKFDIFRLLQAERELLEARFGQVEAWAALWAAEIEIDRTVGEERNP